MSDLTLNKIQALVDEWINTIGITYYSELTNTAILTEEVGEVARLMARIYGEQSFKRAEDEVNAPNMLAEEMADVLFVLVCLANQTGIDLESSMIQNLEKKSIRDRERHKNNPKLSKK